MRSTALVEQARAEVEECEYSHLASHRARRSGQGQAPATARVVYRADRHPKPTFILIKFQFACYSHLDTRA